MDVITVSQALRKEDGELIMAVKGKLTDVNKPFSGTSEKDGEPYSFQNCVFTCTENPKNKIKVKIWNHEDVSNLRGAIVYLLSTRGQGDKAKNWYGVKRAIDYYRNPEGAPMIDCTAKAEVTTIDPNAGESAPAQDQAPRQNQARGNAPQGRQQAAPQKPPQGSGKTAGAPQSEPAREPEQPKSREQLIAERDEAYRGAIQETRFKLGKAANLYLLALRAADHIRTIYNEEHATPMDPGQFQGMTSTLFLHAERQFLAGALPHGDLAKYLPAPKQAEQGGGQ